MTRRARARIKSAAGGQQGCPARGCCLASWCPLTLPRDSTARARRCVDYFTAVQAAFGLQGTAAALALFAFGRMSMFSERSMTVSALETEKPSKASKKITPAEA